MVPGEGKTRVKKAITNELSSKRTKQEYNEKIKYIDQVQIEEQSPRIEEGKL